MNTRCLRIEEVKDMKLKYFFVILLIVLFSFNVSAAPHILGQLKGMDIDKDGSISLEEFNLNTLNHFRLMDLNDDGIITKDEFFALSNLRFKKIDLNSDAILERREIRKGLKQTKKDRKTNGVGEKKQPKPFIKQ